MALERKAPTAAPAFERRRPAPAAVPRSSAAAAPAPPRTLQERLGNQATQAVVRSLQSAKAAKEPAQAAKKPKTAKKPEAAKPAAKEPAVAARTEVKETAIAAKPPVVAEKEKEKEKEKKPATQGEAGEKAAPPSPKQAIAPAVKAVKERSTSARKHGDKGALVGSAQAAAKDPKVEGTREASVATVKTLDDAKTAKVRREKFKADLTAAIKKATPEPKTKDEAEKVVQTGGKEASNALKSSLGAERDAAAGEMKGAAAVDVAPSPSGTKANMESEAVGPKPAPVSAAPVVPAPLPPERLDYSSDRGSTDKAMEESGVTTEQLGKGNEPQFNKTLTERSSAEKHEAAAEAKYRKSEAAVQAQTKAGAQEELAQELGGIHGARALRIGEVTGQQNATRTKDAQERERVTTAINGFKDKTRQDVAAILTKMETDAAAIFEAGLKRAEKAYEDTFEDAKGGIGTWLTTWGDDWEQLIERSLRKARDEYFRQVDLAIEEVANLVDGKLEEAKTRVAAGRKEVEDFVKTLDGKVKEFGDEALKEVSADFDAMGSEIDQRRDALIDKLAEQYKASYERMSAKEEALREANKSLWQRVYDATVGVIKKILAFKDMLVSILAKAAAVVMDIISDPIGFLGNLVSAVMTGLENFMGNIGKHLEKGLMEWLFGALGGAGLQLPDKFDLKGIISIILQVLGLTYANFRARAVAIVGAPVVDALEKTAEVFKIVMTQGISGLWDFIKEKVLDLKSMVLDAIFEFVKEKVLVAGVTWIIGLLNPASAFFKACKAIYDIVKFFIERASQIMALINAIIDSIAAIAKGSTAAAAKKVEDALAKTIPVAIGFLAALLGLGDISGTIRKLIDKAQAPVNKAIDWVIHQAVKLVKAVGGLLGGRSGKKEETKPTAHENDPKKAAKIQAGLMALHAAEDAEAENDVLDTEGALRVVAKTKEKHPVFKTLKVLATPSGWSYLYSASEEQAEKSNEKRPGEGDAKKDRDKIRKAIYLLVKEIAKKRIAEAEAAAKKKAEAGDKTLGRKPGEHPAVVGGQIRTREASTRWKKIDDSTTPVKQGPGAQNLIVTSLKKYPDIAAEFARRKWDGPKVYALVMEEHRTGTVKELEGTDGLPLIKDFAFLVFGVEAGRLDVAAVTAPLTLITLKAGTTPQEAFGEKGAEQKHGGGTFPESMKGARKASERLEETHTSEKVFRQTSKIHSMKEEYIERIVALVYAAIGGKPVTKIEELESHVKEMRGKIEALLAEFDKDSGMPAGVVP